MIPLLLLVALDCTPCHKQIAESFARTPMANSSGRIESLKPAEVMHKPSSTRYKISSNAEVKIETPAAKARQQLDFFIGSGAHGQSFLFVRNRKLYEAPITLYTHKGWGPSPGYENDRNSDWTRPVTRDCLWCHASGAKPIHGTVNTYADPVFTHGGLTCERCHSAAGDHFNNPAKLPIEARADVCRQCHQLNGRTDLKGQSFFSFKPGGLLRDLVRYETIPQLRDTPLSTTSHFERLGASNCAKASGGKLWCGTCHNPHPTKAKSNACLSCHIDNLCRRGPDCASCHMPKNSAPDSGHATFTDHWIR